MRTLTLGPQVVWSDANNILFHPMMAPAASGEFVKGRFHFEMRARTAGCKLRVAARMSDDGINWDTEVAMITTWTQANGSTFGTTWIDIPSLFATVRAYIQIGVQVQGTTAGVNELCVASVKVDLKPQ